MNTYSITNRSTLLNNGDQVTFVFEGKTLVYHVEDHYLNALMNPTNCAIFNLLGLRARTFAQSAYGYQESGGDWPNSRPDDYPALTRLVNALFRLIAEREPHQITKAQSKPESKPRPRVGDRVRLVPSLEAMPRFTGQAGIIIEDDKTKCPFHVALDSGDKIWCCETRVEVIPAPTMKPEEHLDAYLLYLFPLSSGLRDKARAILDVLSKP